MSYDIDFEERGLIKEHIHSILLYPEFWSDATNQISVPLVWKRVKFVTANKSTVPNDKKGIYCFVVMPTYANLFPTQYLFYIGETTRNFQTRFSEYLREQAGKGKPRPRIFKMLKLWRDHIYYYYAEIAADGDILDCEDKLINTFIPIVNTDIPKAKVKPELIDIYR